MPPKRSASGKAPAAPVTVDVSDAPAADEVDEAPAKKSRAAMLASRDEIPRDATPRAAPPAAPERALTFVAWNLGGLRAWLADPVRRVELAATALAASPDVLFILETKLTPGATEDDARALLAECLPAYEATFVSSVAKKGYSGLCALVKRGAAATATVVAGIGECDDEGRVLTVHIERPDRAPLDVVCAYVPNAGQTLQRLDYRINTWDPALRAFLRARATAGAQVVLIGDLNVAHLDADIWNWGQAPSKNKAIGKNAGTTPEERASFGVLLAECELADGFRARHPAAAGCFSFWSVRASSRPVNRGLRLDYALVSAAIAAADASCGDAHGWALHDSFILDELNLRGDHAAVGITLV
jgi:exodeoxyribonuclease III